MSAAIFVGRTLWVDRVGVGGISRRRCCGTFLARRGAGGTTSGGSFVAERLLGIESVGNLTSGGLIQNGKWLLMEGGDGTRRKGAHFGGSAFRLPWCRRVGSALA